MGQDLTEEELFERRRDLFTEVELVFFNTISTSKAEAESQSEVASSPMLIWSNPAFRAGTPRRRGVLGIRRKTCCRAFTNVLFEVHRWIGFSDSAVRLHGFLYCGTKISSGNV